MQITFPGPDGQPVTAVDLRAGRDGSVALPPERRPTVWQAAMLVVPPDERRPASSLIGTMKV